MRTRILFFIIVAVVVTMLQVSVIAQLGWAHLVSLPLVFIVLLTLSVARPHSGGFALLAGFLLDLYSPYPFGIHGLSLTIVALVTRALIDHFFTNRSVYAMILLTLAMTALDVGIWFGVLAFLQTLQKGTDFSSSVLTPWLLLGNVSTATVLFYLGLLSHRLFGRLFFTRRTSVQTSHRP